MAGPTLDSLIAAFLLTGSAARVAVAGVAFFLALYVGGALLTLGLTRALLALGHGRFFDPRPLATGQIAREVLLSLGSVLIFGTGLLLPWGLVQVGWARFAADPSVLSILAEALVLALWNELHFYLCHRLLHSPALRRFHLPHHRSVVPTPWSTYAFHPFEALLLGSVILPPMLVHDFSATALACLPVLSLTINAIGHSNFDFLPRADPGRWWLNGARRHHLHHACYGGNYGFMLPFLDRWLGTDLPLDAARPMIARGSAAVLRSERT